MAILLHSAIFIILSIIIILVAMSDCDLPLYLLPKTPQQAFKGKIIWITGASSGIGASLARDLTLAGAQVTGTIGSAKHVCITTQKFLPVFCL